MGRDLIKSKTESRQYQKQSDNTKTSEDVRFHSDYGATLDGQSE